MKNALVIYFCFFLTCLHSQTIPTARLGNWLEVGADKDAFQISHVIDVSDFGIVGSEDQIIADEFNNLLQNNKNIAVEFYFPAGIYVFSEPIVLFSDKIIRGDGANTIFRFLDLGEQSLINVKGTLESDFITLKYDLPENSVSSVLNFSPAWQEGDLIYLYQEDDDKVTSNWAKNNTGNIGIIDEINGSTLYLRNGTNQEFKVDKFARCARMFPIKNVGIEGIKIEPTFKTNSQTNNIAFQNAYNCWVSCVESYNCNFSHILIDKSRNISVTTSYFQDGFDYGGGGRAYGTTIQNASKHCLIEENVYSHLRHSILFQSGANNNVIGYNYSKDPFWTSVILPANSAGDIVLHGNFPFDNLIEGNICQNIVIDDSHGINGGHNTFFRNRTESYGIFMNNGEPTDNQNFVGNLIVRNEIASILPLYVLAGQGHFAYGNSYIGTTQPEPVTALSDSTYYLFEPSALKNKLKEFDLIGLPAGVTTEYNPAKHRFLVEGKKTTCADGISSTAAIQSDQSVNLYPNPSPSGLLNLTNSASIARDFGVTNSFGKIIYTGTLPIGTSEFDFSNLPTGFYFIQVVEDGSPIRTFKWVR